MNVLYGLLFVLLAIARARPEAVNVTNVSVLCLDPGANCSSSDTNYTAATQAPEAPPMWCPSGYRLMRTREGVWVHACQPMSCSGPPSDATRRCERMSVELRSCPTMYLAADQFRLDDGSLIDDLHNETLPLGDYVLVSDRAIVCDYEWNETLPDPPHRADLPPWCMPIPVPPGGHQLQGQGLFVGALGREVALFSVNQDGFAHVCPEMDPAVYATCEFPGSLPGDEIEVLPSWEIQDRKNILTLAVFPTGQYILAVDRSFAVICIESGEALSDSAMYVYGAASMFSAFCLLLALLAHLFFPRLNYHAKALLCFAFSLFVMYIAVAVRNFAGNIDSAAANLTLFSVQYIFALAAFFWLSILAFDLWRVFADLRGTITPGNTVGKKRVFLAKCVYAWGIPTVLCIIIISLAFYPDAQKSLRLDLPLKTTNWIQDTTTMLIIFYLPLSIVLLENLIFFVLTIINLRKASSGTDILNKRLNRKLFKVYMKLFMVMGLSWIAEIISWLVVSKTGEAAWYVTDIINCLQGAFIFLIYVCKKKTLLIMRNKMGQISSSQITSSTSSSRDRDRKISAISMEAMQKRSAMETSKSSVKSISNNS